MLPYPQRGARVFVRCVAICDWDDADVAGEATIEDTRAMRFVPRLRALLR